ncbi:hypothetical protein CTAYLR_005636 [Chrysophaeum taylorii]|uniref:ENTH domain-containing protein n=1 Tax=Chrysophaeum taylorii TaxID=2483200 RepID=A0AAD7UQ97_9STRA|nr:hypothetical protein CTAYLR_005636 [Chrysophaeum taylorii]
MASLDKLRNLAEDAYGTARGMRDDTEKKVFEALNNKNWGASSTTLNEIARETFSYDKFGKIFKLIWEAADGAPRNWRKIFKALMLCEYLVKNGCERCVDEVRDHQYRIRQLQDFNYSEERLDRGQGVREKAKQLIELLSDNANIREARDSAKRLRDKFVGQGGNRYGGYGNDGLGSGGGFGSTSYSGGSGGYSDNGGFSSAGYSDDPKPSSEAAQGRYANDSVATAPSDGLQLKLKPKAKAVPRIKMKDQPAPPPVVKDQPSPAVETTPDLFAATPQEDIFDSFSQPAAGFDPRGSGNDFAAFDTAPIQQTPAAFADFGDAFAAQPQPVYAQSPPRPPQQQQFLPPMQQQQQQQQQFGGMYAAPLPPAQQPPVVVAPNGGGGDDGFGDFDAAPAVEEPPKPKPDALAEAGKGLVSLDSLTLNSNAKTPAPTAPKASYAQHAAFTGLDGFSTNPQPTMMGSVGYQYQQPQHQTPMHPQMRSPMQQHHQQQQPSPQMGGPPPVVQQQYAAGVPQHHQQMFNAPMGGYPQQPQPYGYPPPHQQQQPQQQQHLQMGYGGQPMGAAHPYAGMPGPAW